jgi:hypothetical protein
MKTDNIKTINAHQQQIYDQFGKDMLEGLLNNYANVLAKVKNHNSLKIIDLGGGGGVF